MIFNDAEIAALKSDVQNIAAFFRLETDPVVRLAVGLFGNIEVGSTILDPSGAVYQGFGEISSLPEFTQMVNGAADRVEFVLSGVDGKVLQIAASDADSVKGKRVSVGIGLFGADWQLLGSPHWIANYRADLLMIEQPPATQLPSGQQGIIRTLTLSCGTLLTSRRRPGYSYFSHEDQQARSPGDNFCEFTPRYANNFAKKWPTFP
jgi:hypothetical protein